MITVIDMKDIPSTRGIKKLEVQRDIEEFLASASEEAEVKVPDGRKAASVYATYRKSAVENKHAVNIITRSGRVFLTRKDATQ